MTDKKKEGKKWTEKNKNGAQRNKRGIRLVA